MSLPETIWWCENHRSAGNDQRCEFHLRQPAPWAFTCEMIELRVAGPDDLLIRREDIDYETAVAYLEVHLPEDVRPYADRMATEIIAAALVGVRETKDGQELPR